jgi:hypothetical protein
MHHGFWGGTNVPLYTMVKLITMVQVYHLKNHGTFYHGITMVVLWQYHGQMYHSFWRGTIVPWLSFVPWYTMKQMYHPNNHGILNHGITKVKCIMVSWGGTFVPR